MMQKIKKRVYLNEFNVALDNAVYLPFVSGKLAAYAQSKNEIKSNYVFLPFLFIREKLENIISEYQDPDVAAFSVYMWNEQLSLKIAEEVKRRFPDCLIVFGGPQVPSDAGKYFKRYSFIDIVVHGEGEEVFSQILLRFLDNNDFNAIDNISWRRKSDAQVVQNSLKFSGLENLDLFPSPYLSGYFDDLLKNRSGTNFQAIIETNRGCPFSCIYCVWSKASSGRKLRFYSLQRIKDEFEWVAKNRIKYLFNADSNFGISNRDIDIVHALTETKEKYNCPEKLRACFARNSEENIYEMALLMHRSGLSKGVTLSFQSLDSKVLDNVKRQNITMETYRKLLLKFNKENIPVYTELILGLPGENFESWKKGIENVIESGLRGQLFIYPCEVYPNTELSDKDYQEKFLIKTRQIPLTEIHGSLRQDADIREYQQIIISTKSMPLEEWRKMMTFSWLTMLFYSLKLGFFILAYLARRFNIRFIDLIEHLMQSSIPEDCIVINKQIDNYQAYLDGLLDGKSKALADKQFGNIYWDVEELSFLQITQDKDRFYDEISVILQDFLKKMKIDFQLDELSEVVRYQNLRIPDLKNEKIDKFTFKYNLPEFFESWYYSKDVEIKPFSQILEVKHKEFKDKAEFAREITLWGRKSDNILLPAFWKIANQVRV